MGSVNGSVVGHDGLSNLSSVVSLSLLARGRGLPRRLSSCPSSCSELDLVEAPFATDPPEISEFWYSEAVVFPVSDRGLPISEGGGKGPAKVIIGPDTDVWSSG